MADDKNIVQIGVFGCRGRVGKLIVQELQSGEYENAALAGGSIRADHIEDKAFFVTPDPPALLERADVLIDFTAPDATMTHADLAAEHKKPLVIGTTGLVETQERHLEALSKDVPIVYAANMSLGVNVLLTLVKQTAAALGPEYDIEIAETHHRHKVDAPSGTALALGHAAADGRDIDHDIHAIHDRHGHTGPRKSGMIGYAVQRGGDVVGEHTVTFFGDGERLEIGHKATDRSLFAKGAIRAAIWAKDQKPGLYGMTDVLGLN